MSTGRPLTVRQQEALLKLGVEWGRPPRLHVNTLLSLQARGLAECRLKPGGWSGAWAASYASSSYQWRLKPQ